MFKIDLLYISLIFMCGIIICSYVYNIIYIMYVYVLVKVILNYENKRVKFFNKGR